MAKLYFKYGAMGSSKTATALITKYNYEERGMRVWLIKPAADRRDGEFTLRSRIGLTAQCEAIGPECDLREQYAAHGRADVIIVDECQFLTGQQIDQLRELVDRENLPVLCFGLRTDFQTKLFPGSRRLFELADYRDQNHLRLRPQGDHERPHQPRRLCRHRGRSGLPGRQRQLYRHVP